ncbi:glycine--tRNA ligase beta subunit [Tepiditoga spiralis]|uniref:Glycine--tRNA ligase beta subunit n=1 Tax=Tepiditoga spiralis TaxID=2108365 RepID=A0A7G1GAC4_9BACT|nr:glycine--tRNA ligase subunit beta [Tepiditoga spiralis]BBE30389.1 glycine--tRNA ligase beta subunit [Tepiditoga spiralis]
MNKLLFEIGMEELPSSEYKNIKKQLNENIEKFLKENNLKYEKINIFISPRRFGSYITGLSDSQPDKVEERKGPAKSVAYNENGEPTKALLGFLKGAKATEKDIIIKEFKGNEYVFIKIERKGKTTKKLFEENLPKIIKSIKFKKSMKWGNGDYEFVRPVHWILGMYNKEILDFEIFGKKASNITYGHRFFGGKIELKEIEKYFEELKNNYVIANFEERVQKIKNDLQQLKEKNNIKIEQDEDLIIEIAELTEYPTGVIGTFNEKYMKLPYEIIEVTVKHHQRSFVVKDENKYISFQDGIGREENIIKGYSRVINARLDDAAFYYEDDLKVSIEDNLKSLEKITYQKGIGNYKEKVERIEKLSEFIANELKIKEVKEIKRAAKLSKIDIPSNVVYEFPEMQGIMGRIYLKNKGETENIYLTAEEHYHPIEENDKVTKNIVSDIVSLADRIDDIVGYFGIGKIPSGSKDPFALRRKSFGVFRIIIENDWDIDIKNIVKKASEILNLEYDENKLEDFFKSRFETILLKEGIKPDILSSVITNYNKPLRAIISAKALLKYSDSKEFKEFITAFQRVNNISKKHNSTEYQGRLFVEEVEKNLFEKYLETKAQLEDKIKILDYEGAMEKLINLKEAIDTYFDNIFVMDKDESIRLNRLGFLKTISEMFKDIGDVSKLYQ